MSVGQRGWDGVRGAARKVGQDTECCSLSPLPLWLREDSEILPVEQGDKLQQQLKQECSSKKCPAGAEVLACWYRSHRNGLRCRVSTRAEVMKKFRV